MSSRPITSRTAARRFARLVLPLCLFAGTALLHAGEVVGQITGVDQAHHRVQIDGNWFKLPSTLLIRRETGNGRLLPTTQDQLQPGRSVSFEAEKNTIHRLLLLQKPVDAMPLILSPPPGD